MKIEITRSFSKKIQVKQYEPLEWFCSAKAEVDGSEAEQMSATLDNFVQGEVAKALNLYEFVKPISKFDFKKDYTKLNFVEPKSKDQGQDSAERDTEQFIPKGEFTIENG